MPKIFNPKVFAIEELSDLKTLPINQLVGTLTSYEKMISKDKSTTGEESFKSYKNSDSDMDVTQENFVRRWKKGLGK